MSPWRNPTPEAARRQAIWIIVGTSVLWGFTFPQIEALIQPIDFISINVIRFGMAAVFLLAWVFLSKRSLKPALVPGIILGLILSIGYAGQNLAIELNGGAVAGFLFSLYNVMAPIIAFLLLGESLTRRLLLAVFMCGVGIALTVLGSQTNMAIVGVVVLLICCVFFAFHVVLTRRYTPRADPIALVAIQACVIAFSSPIGYLFIEPRFEPLSPLGWASLLWLGFISTAISYVIVTWAQRHVTAGLAAILLCIEPPVAALSSYAFGADLHTLQWFGGASVVIAMLVMTWPSRGKVPV